MARFKLFLGALLGLEVDLEMENLDLHVQGGRSLLEGF